MTEKSPLTSSGRVRSVTFAVRGIRTMVASQAALAIGTLIIGALVFWPKVVGLLPQHSAP
jgi:hypothetical protein